MKKHTIKLIFLGTGCFLIISGCLFLPYLLTDTPMVLGWDFRGQYNMFYSNLKVMLEQLVSDHTLPFYSWNLFLGNNFWASKLFYYHDFFEWIAALCSSAHYYQVQLVLSWIKLLIAALSFTFYGRSRHWRPLPVLIGSLLFAFSSTMLDSLKDPLFLSFTIFLPLYFYAMDQFLIRRKKGFYIIITAFLLIINYYSFYTLSVFSVFVFLYRYYEIYGTLRGFFKPALTLIGYYLVAVCCAGIVAIPCFLDIASNSRLLHSSFLWKYPAYQPYFSVFSALVTPTSMLVNRALDFESIYSYVTPNRTDLYLCLWSGSITALLIAQPMFNKKTGKAARVFMGIMLLLMLLPVGSSMMHGFSEPSYRWIQMLVFFNLTLILPYLDQSSKINRPVLILSAAFCAAILIFSIPLLAHLLGVPFKEVQTEYYLVLPTLLFLGLFTCIFLFSHQYRNRWLLMLCTLELSWVGYQSLYGNPFFREWSWERVNEVEQALGQPGELINYLNGLDPHNYSEYYRVYIPRDSLYWGYSSNLNLKYQFPGVMTYDSTFSPALNDLSLLIDNPNYLPWNIELEDPFYLDYVGVKYAIITEESELPHKDFILVGEYRGLPVYQNLHYQGILRSYGQAETIEQYQQSADSSKVLNTLISDEKTLQQLQGSFHDAVLTVDSLIHYGNTLHAQCSSSSDTVVTLSIPYDRGWKILVNHQAVPSYNSNGGMLTFTLTAGDNLIEMYYVPPGLKAGILFSTVGFVIFAILMVGQQKTRKNRGGFR